MNKFQTLDDAIKTAKKTPTIQSLVEIGTYTHYQVRHVRSNTVHIDTIAERINDKSCSTLGMEPIVVLANYRGPGLHSMLDGNHRYKAALKSCASDYPVIFIEKSVWIKYTSLELQEYGLILNKLSEQPRLEINKADVQKFLYSYWSEHKHFDGAKSALLRMGLTKSMADTRIREGKRLMEQDIYLDGMGKDLVWLNWSDPEMYDRLQKEKKSRQVEGLKLFVVSSANFSYDGLLPSLLDERPKNLLILLHHPTLHAEQAWESKWEKRHKRYIDQLCRFLGINKSWDTLPKYETNALSALIAS